MAYEILNAIRKKLMGQAKKVKFSQLKEHTIKILNLIFLNIRFGAPWLGQKTTGDKVSVF
jgi:hypothetical protein